MKSKKTISIFAASIAAAFFVGAIFNGGRGLPDDICESLYLETDAVVRSNTRKIEDLERLSRLFLKQCKGYKHKAANRIDDQETKPLPDKTCEAIEFLILERIKNNGNASTARVFFDRADFYASLTKNGCPENQSKYRDLAIRDANISQALNRFEFSDHINYTELFYFYISLGMMREASAILDNMKKNGYSHEEDDIKRLEEALRRQQ
ncbi:MAG: hypothetical protein LBB08_00085 [Rickettsiales bacterium]|jgi:hypothetical protein|nr:hypothetical protein [Rickettsiales bacterium]